MASPTRKEPISVLLTAAPDLRAAEYLAGLSVIIESGSDERSAGAMKVA
jgi:hypothetical protein